MAADSLRLLIVEDDPGLQSQLRWAMSDHTVMVADNREKALAIAQEKAPQVAVLDLGLPPDPDGASEGLATLQALLRLDPAIKVIVASGNEERANAVRAISLGAYDFCAKPVDIELLRLIVERVYNVYRLETEHEALLRRSNSSTLGGIITGDPAMQRVGQTVEKIARTDVTLLITGESGTGKELLARALHDLSGRAKGNFVAINCAAIPENLLESELFGYEKGAFTGAVRTTPGKIETADGGTLFLDEIGDLPASLQAKLLRFLQDRLIERVGGRKPIPVDVRIVCATNQKLEQMIEQGAFREDLYYRLNEMRVEVPPLRERHGDAVMLAKFFLGRFNKQYNKSLRGFAADALSAIAAYNWPGNVRQLENSVRKSVVMADGRTVTAADLGLSEVADRQTPIPTLQEVRKEAERKLVSGVLATTQGNISKTAKILGVSRPTLYMMMRNLGLRAEE
jgi:two-component system NtrC family response regulator